jgi:N-methylhydantoinase A
MRTKVADEASSLRVAVDTGGTFTDVVAIDEAAGRTYVTKTASTPRQPAIALMEGLRKVTEAAGAQPRSVTTLIHGTTTATNALLEGRFDRLGLLVTKGFRHLLEIARQSVPDGYGNSYFWVKPPRIVPLERVYEISGRMDHAGHELKPLAEEDVEAAATRLGGLGVDCVAICLLHAYANDRHERRARELLLEKLPGAFVSISSEVLSEYREYERAMTTTIDVMVKPHTRDYLVRAEAELADRTGGVPFLIMQSNGGVVGAAKAAEKPITTLLSGPAAGVLGATFVAERAGYRDILTLDAGGTSTDIALVEDLKPLYTSEGKFDRFPVKTPMIDVVAVGTGGGSIAWVGPQRALKVGPRSAGADPGPMCYGRGGEEPTVTDANLVLGRIPPFLVGGQVALDVDRAEKGIAALGERIGLGPEETASGILEIAAWNQSNGIRRVSIERGREPSDYCLVAFGGSGGMLAHHVADLLEIRTVLVPENPGNLSAFGLQVADIKRDYVTTLVRAEDRVRAAELEAAWAALERHGRDDLIAEGVGEADIVLVRSADMRYVGEAHEVPVSAGEGGLDEPRLAQLFGRFHDVHERTFGYAYRGRQPGELVNLRVQAIGSVRRPRLEVEAGLDAQAANPISRRNVYFAGLGSVACPIYEREALPPGSELAGPAVIQEFGSTVVVYDGWHLRVDKYRNLICERG